MPNLTAMLTAGILSLNTSTNSIQSACLLSSTKWPMKGEQTLSRRGKKRKRKKERKKKIPPQKTTTNKTKLRRPDGIFQRAKCELKSFLFQNTLACAAGFHSKDKHASVHQSCLFLMHNWCGELYNSRSELSNETKNFIFSITKTVSFKPQIQHTTAFAPNPVSNSRAAYVCKGYTHINIKCVVVVIIKVEPCKLIWRQQHFKAVNHYITNLRVYH